MASEEEANTARRLHGQTLIEHGAHAIGVADGAAYGHEGFVVVAHVAERKKVDLPSSLPTAAKASATVPVVIERGEPFSLE